jgi:hypothetical protein
VPKTENLLVYETWSLTLREEYRLGMLCSMILRKIFEPECDEVTGDCGKQHNEGLVICIAHRILLG